MKRHPATLWGIGAGVSLVLYLAVGWFMWSASNYIELNSTGGQIAYEIWTNEYVGEQSVVWEPAYGFFRWAVGRERS